VKYISGNLSLFNGRARSTYAHSVHSALQEWYIRSC